jgi:hypothetical protein
VSIVRIGQDGAIDELAREGDVMLGGKDWDQMYPLDKYYQDMHLNLSRKRSSRRQRNSSQTFLCLR